ncbi:hypothetical protein ABMA28_010789 [Loxostege sticticalis]|uniref:Major facilitator superfamily (MFS) profile domain-containing protein n=1 Tax=Loxostege sticticalis TaxID=481309 RepID=A0ABD0S9G5_LOXSC
MLTPFFRQSWHASGVHINMIGVGMMMGYTSALLPALKAPDSLIKVDLDTASWISSSVGFSAIPGIIVSSYLMHVWGRRVSYLIVQVPGIIGWPCIYFANDVGLLLLGRILGGFTGGACVSLGSVAIGEYSSPQNRGMFLNLKTASVCIGSAIVHAFGHFYHWRTLALIATVPYLISFAIICTWVESPAWLASKKRFDASENAFIFLRGDDDLSRREITDLIRVQRIQIPKKQKNLQEMIMEYVKKCGRKDFYKPLFIMTVLFILLEFSGRHIFPAYAAEIIIEVTGNKGQAFYYTLGIDIVIALSATISSAIVKVMRRRPMLFSTGFGSVVVLALVCTYLYMISQDMISKDRPWIPISLFVLYFILANQGCTPVPIALLGEIFPLEHRSLASCLSGIVLSICINIGLLITPYLMLSLKVYGTFAVFGVITSTCLVILYFILPETKDRTLQEIEDYFKTGRLEDNNNQDLEAKEKMLVEMKNLH